MREKDIELYLRRQAKNLGCMVYKFVSPGKRGVPDDIVLWPHGGLDFVELKQDKGKLSELQVVHLKRLTDMGQRCYVLYGKADVDAYLLGALIPWKP